MCQFVVCAVNFLKKNFSVFSNGVDQLVNIDLAVVAVTRLVVLLQDLAEQIVVLFLREAPAAQSKHPLGKITDENLVYVGAVGSRRSSPRIVICKEVVWEEISSSTT